MSDTDTAPSPPVSAHPASGPHSLVGRAIDQLQMLYPEAEPRTISQMGRAVAEAMQKAGFSADAQLVPSQATDRQPAGANLAIVDGDPADPATRRAVLPFTAESGPVREALERIVGSVHDASRQALQAVEAIREPPFQP